MEGKILDHILCVHGLHDEERLGRILFQSLPWLSSLPELYNSVYYGESARNKSQSFLVRKVSWLCSRYLTIRMKAD